MIKKILSLLLASALLICVCIPSFAASSEGVNLAYVKKNMSGDGYRWDNINKVLTFENLEIYTDQDFGFKVPAGARIELKGDNVIHAGKYGLGLVGAATFDGDGSLEIKSEVAGIFSYSDNANHKILFRNGEYSITSETPVKAVAAELSFTGGNYTLKSEEGKGIECSSLIMSDITLISEGSLKVGQKADISYSSLKIESNDDAPALDCNNKLRLGNMTMKAGDSEDSAAECEEYGFERYLSSESGSHSLRRSFLFGDKCSVVVDILILIVVLASVAALIAVPYVRKKKKVKRMYEELERNGKGENKVDE